MDKDAYSVELSSASHLQRASHQGMETLSSLSKSLHTFRFSVETRGSTARRDMKGYSLESERQSFARQVSASPHLAHRKRSLPNAFSSSQQRVLWRINSDDHHHEADPATEETTLSAAHDVVVTETIGIGGTATVFLGEEQHTRRLVAVKRFDLRGRP